MPASTFQLRKLLMASRLRVPLETFEANVTLTNVVEDDYGFDAGWEVTVLGEIFLKQLIQQGYTTKIERVV